MELGLELQSGLGLSFYDSMAMWPPWPSSGSVREKNSKDEGVVNKSRQGGGGDCAGEIYAGDGGFLF